MPRGKGWVADQYGELDFSKWSVRLWSVLTATAIGHSIESRIVTPARRRLGVEMYADRNDWWVGYFRGDKHHYVCPLPTFVIRWNRKGGQ